MFISFFSNEALLKGLAYLADIFNPLNKFNLKLQRSDTNILQFKYIWLGLVNKIKNWKRKVCQGNSATFENLSSFEHCISAQLKLDTCEHLQSLESEF